MRSISVHFKEIHEKGWSELFRKIKRFCTEDKFVTDTVPIFFSLLFSLVWALPLIMLIRCLKTWRLFRIGEINSRRIGHFCFDASEQLVRLKNKPDNAVDWFWFKEPSSNSLLALVPSNSLY